MRIIAGVAKGRRLHGPSGTQTRPLTDRAKEGLFSSLGGAVVGAQVLDLYAGTGSLGLEALSRGAAGALFVERSRAAVTSLRRNVEAVGLGGEVVVGDVEPFLRSGPGPFDLVFVDPPYALPLASQASVLASVEPLLVPGGVVVLHRRFGAAPPPVPPRLVPADRRRYGDTELLRFVKDGREEEDE